MFRFRGDAHRFYMQLKRRAGADHKKLDEIAEIRNFYQSIDTDNLKTISYRMLKEKSGSGIIPILVTAIPWFFFLFSKQLQQFLFKDGSFLWVVFGFLYLSILTVSVTLHFREKAWAALHIKIIEDILSERKK